MERDAALGKPTLYEFLFCKPYADISKFGYVLLTGKLAPWVLDTRHGAEVYVGMHRNLVIWLGTPMMVLTWLVIPIMPAFLLFLHRKELGKPRIQLQFGYIYRCYR